MYLYWLFFVFLSLCAFRNWKKTVIVWMPLQLLFNDCVCLKYSQPAVSLTLGVNILLLMTYFVCGKKRSDLDHSKFIFKSACIVYLCSFILSMLFSIVPVSVVLTHTIKFFVNGYFILFLFYKALQNKNDIILFFKVTVVVVLLIVGLAFYETIIVDNPVLDFVYSNAPSESIYGKMYYTPPFIGSGDLQRRYGLVRAYSFFSIHIGLGCACTLLYFLFMHSASWSLRVYKKYMVMIILLLCGVLLCNSKTPLLGTFMFTCAFVSMKKIFKPKVVFCVLVLIVAVLIYAPDYLNNIVSFWDEDVASEGKGSDLNMRMGQFAIGIMLFQQSPILGNGVGANAVFLKKYEDVMFGMESSWLQILPERGLIGVLAYLYLYVLLYRILRKCMSWKEVFFFITGLMAMETVTGFMDFALYGSIVIVIYKYWRINSALSGS